MDYKFVPKGWGYEKWIVNKPEYCGKILFIAKDRKLSLHYHKLKDETFYVQQGKAMVFYYGNGAGRYMNDDIAGTGWETVILRCLNLTLGPGASLHIPRGMRHAILAIEDTTIVEFSTEHFDEDSYRVLKGD